ncbi:hypothetical protein BMON_0485 [Bifidobacterium mongoliense DSM 21395]|uniref:Uncharacterized protein n=1 Tax=Bifidobacterium mongoliense DSM 21395 TaxID=1437603 RepID=A0A087C7M8_9BIFI|nr:hypothetical protein BMON_0485 [Bifidobacterium mongoliense DSM 21395]
MRRLKLEFSIEGTAPPDAHHGRLSHDSPLSWDEQGQRVLPGSLILVDGNAVGKDAGSHAAAPPASDGHNGNEPTDRDSSSRTPRPRTPDSVEPSGPSESAESTESAESAGNPSMVPQTTESTEGPRR